MDISTAGIFGGGDPDQYAETNLYAAGALGQFYAFPRDSKTGLAATASNFGMKIFQLVKITSVTSYAQGAPLYWSDHTKFEVTTAVTNLGQLAGLAVTATAPTANQFVLMQVRGRGQVVVKGSPTATPDATGQPVIGCSTIATFDVLAVGTAPPTYTLGVTLGAIANSFCPVRLTVALNA